MNEIVISTHSFEIAKNKIKKFSQSTPKSVSIKKVDNNKTISERFFSGNIISALDGDHKVTGTELNEITLQIQKHLINANETQVNIIKEFEEVYNALESLDKDYIQTIIVNIKAAEENSERIADAQDEIEKIFDDQKRTLEILKKFKEKIDNYTHLGRHR